ncbi:MAG: 30S ribosomal protein S4 [Planctomycetota bacterium]|jgi:small subunit ribosomal protein S4|nr:30S ribosomal protein S4 [Gemmataceae bacterium]MCY2971583.1 30S ribosomal protein S4 [Planctomycetota bacterium]NBS89058.1 30S ribosomal protein S4 [bacterium]NBT61050.1 30S ribosomal protein S4 [Planctomycetia bacterium]MBJ7343725.1 30S ribosomal protein S4 [Gemmataceae bacterium]
MARITDPVCRICRREGVKLYLKGLRCESPKCAIERRNQPPGMHLRRGKPSEYGIRLREKQKLKRFYGLLERQFRRYFEIASRSKQNTGEVLITLLERRLDNVVFRLGFAPNRAAARQLVAHGHVTINGVPTDIPSLIMKPNDVVAVKNRKRSIDLVRLQVQQTSPNIPDFLTITNQEPPEGKMTRMPTRGDMDPHIEEIREQLIIEFCSR